MNTTPQAISRILNAAGIKKSNSYKGRITMMASEGYEVNTDSKGNIRVTYRQRTGSIVKWADFLPTFGAAMMEISEILEAKGYELDIIDDSFIVTKAGA